MYNVCLIGHGYWGEKLARNFNNSEMFNLISIVDKKLRNLYLAKKNYPFVKCFNNYKKAIQNFNLDLVIISTPTSTHFKIAEYALKNSNHVLVEKPLSLSSNEVKKLNILAKKKNKMIFVDYPFLFSGTINFIKKIVEKLIITPPFCFNMVGVTNLVGRTALRKYTSIPSCQSRSVSSSIGARGP